MRFRHRELKCAFVVLILVVTHFKTPAFGEEDKKFVDDQADRVVLQLPYLHTFNYAGFYAAQEKGFYQEEGLTVTILEGSPDFTPTEKILAGEANFGVQNDDLLLEFISGKSVVVLAVLLQHSPWALMVDAKSQIVSPQDLAGKTIMLEMNSRDASILAMLRHEGVSIEELNIVRSIWNEYPVFDGDVDAQLIYLNAPFGVVQPVDRHYRLIKPINYGIDFYGDSLFTSRDEIRRHPERVSAFRHASLKGWEYALEHADEIIDVILFKPSVKERGLTREFFHSEAEETRKLMAYPLVEVGHINPGRWQHMAETYVSLGMATTDYSFDGFLYDPSSKPDHTWVRWLGGISGTVFLLALFILAWNRHLRFQVRRQTSVLEDREERIRLLLDSTAEGIYGIDMDNNCTFANPACVRMLGYRSASDLIGKNMHRLIHHRKLGQTEDQTTLLLSHKPNKTGSGIHVDNETLWRADGSSFPAEYWAYPIRQNGELIGSVVTFLDITERKRVESELIEHREHLEELVREQTKELRKAKEEAEAASGLKSQFLANMSHEIRTPLNAIKGFADLVLDTKLTKQQYNYLGMLKNSSDSLLAVINDILDFSKIEAGKLALEEIQFNLRDLIGDTLHILAIRAYNKGLDLDSHISSDIPNIVIGDPNRFRQIIINLVGNAIRFTETGEIVVSLCLESETESHVILKCSVKDTGVGIPAEQQGRVYKAFEQADSSVTRQFGGTGLGLAISTQLVDRMNGKMWLESELGKGSTFYFTVQLGLIKESQIEISTATLPKLSGIRALVVDNSAITLDTVKELLMKWKLIPTLVTTTEEANERLHQSLKDGAHFELLICNADMPEHGSLTLVKRMRQNPDLAPIKVVLLTKGMTGEYFQRYGELGVESCVEKPIKQSALLEALVEPFRDGVSHTRKPSSHKNGFDQDKIENLDLRVLLVEDNHLNQVVARDILEKWGCKVAVAENGKIALSVLEDNRYDLILMDVQMPVMDGLETTTIIRQREKSTLTHMPIIAMTAGAMKGNEEQCYEAGVDAFISKPIDKGELFKAMRALFNTFGKGGISTHASKKTNSDDSDSSASKGFNKEYFLKRVEGNRQRATKLVDILVKDSPEFLGRIQEAISTKNGVELSNAAHALKGMIKIFTDTGAANTVVKLETMGESGDFSDAKGLHKHLEMQIQQLVGNLRNILR